MRRGRVSREPDAWTTPHELAVLGHLPVPGPDNAVVTMERSQDLEIYRGRFLGELSSAQPQLNDHQQFIHYWRVVEREAKETEELGKLENWVRDLARDKERVQGLKERLETADQSDAMAQALLQIVRQVLMLLEDIGLKIRRRRDRKRNSLAWLLFKAGPGVKKKLPQDDKKGSGTKKEEDETTVTETVLQKPAEPKKPTKKMSR